MSVSMGTEEENGAKEAGGWLEGNGGAGNQAPGAGMQSQVSIRSTDAGASSREESPPPGPGSGEGGSRERGSRSRSRGRDRVTGRDTLKLLSICDRETGVCLFQRCWRWQEAKEPGNIGKLVQSFYQFAREVDGGEISCVNFAAQPRAHRRMSSSQAPRRVRNSSKSPPEAIQLLCTHNEDVVIAVFHEIKSSTVTTSDNQAAVSSFLHQVKEAFGAAYRGRVSSLRPTLRRCAEGDTNDEVLAGVQEDFEDFGASVERLSEACFPAKT